MAEGKKHVQLGRSLNQKYEAPPSISVAGSAFALKVHHAGGVMKVEVQGGMVPPAEHIFTADCGIARVRHGSPELRFMQLNPDDETKVNRLVTARYTWERFRERAGNHEEFRVQLDKYLASSKQAIEAGYFAKLCTAATADNPPSAQLDSDLEITSYSGDRASIVLIVSSIGDLARAAVGEGENVKFTAQIEVTLATRALADLLASWKSVAELGATK